MLLTSPHLRPFPAVKFHPPPLPFPISPRFPISPTELNSRRASHKAWVSQLSEERTTSAITEAPPPPEGPIEIPPSMSPIFATSDDPTPLQTATSVLLTGAITVFLFRTIRRRAKRAKETRFRSSGENKSSLAEEAMESLKSVTLSPVGGKSPPSPVQAFLGAITAGVIALILFKFATTVEASLNRQTISDNYSVRQITITIRTIINGLCYLATFVFGINAVGLFLYSGQLAFNSFMEDSGSESENKSQSSSSSSADSKSGDNDTDGSEINRATEDQQ